MSQLSYLSGEARRIEEVGVGMGAAKDAIGDDASRQQRVGVAVAGIAARDVAALDAGQRPHQRESVAGESHDACPAPLNRRMGQTQRLVDEGIQVALYLVAGRLVGGIFRSE